MPIPLLLLVTIITYYRHARTRERASLSMNQSKRAIPLTSARRSTQANQCKNGKYEVRRTSVDEVAWRHDFHPTSPTKFEV